MPSRSLMVSVSASASTVKDSASHGSVSPVSALRRPRASTAGLKLKRLDVVLDSAGNMLLLSIASTVSMPPYWGVASSASAAGRTDRSISTERNSAVSFLSFMGLPPLMCRSIFSAFRRLEPKLVIPAHRGGRRRSDRGMPRAAAAFPACSARCIAGSDYGTGSRWGA
jgi:hypothetical protein